MRYLLALCCLLVWSTCVWAQKPATCPVSPDGVTTYRDYQDTTYGRWVRQIVRPQGNDRNLYHFRNPFNSNNTYMIGVREGGINDHSAANAYVSLYTGDGCFIRQLYAVNDMNWALVWSKTDPNVFYTNDGPRLMKYDVKTDTRDQLLDLAATGEGVATGGNLTLNQAGTRIGIQLAGTAPHRFRSWALPNMTDERTLIPTDPSWSTAPANCDKRNWRYTGWGNVVVTDCRNEPAYGSGFYEDSGQFVRYTSREIGHVDVGPTGLFAWFEIVTGNKVDVHLTDLKTGIDQTIHQFPNAGWQNLHLSWPRANPNFFVIGFFPNGAVPFDGTTAQTAPSSELYKLTPTNPSVVTPLAKLYTTEYGSAAVNDQGINAYFWTQPEPSLSADGSRVLYNTNCDPKPINNVAPVPPGNCVRAFEGDSAILFTAESGPPPEPPTNQPPVAKANGPYAGLAGQPIAFNSIGSYDPDGASVTYAWDFGDYTSSTEQNPSHTYTSAGTFTATLTVTDTQGATATDTATVLVTEEVKPPTQTTAEANGPYTAVKGTAIALSSQGSHGAAPAGGRIQGTRWDFGDGTISTEAHPTHIYTDTGDYTATLLITDESCSTATDTTSITITEPPSNQPPVAEANGPYSAKLGQPIAFSSQGSSDPDGQIVSYLWTFSDGATSTEANPSHTYATAGSYTVSLVVMDSGGNTSTDTAAVTVTKGR